MFAVTVYFGHYFAAAHYDYAVGHTEDLRHFRRYHDNALAVLAKSYYERGEYVTAAEHRPDYLRLSQAERERMEKMQK